MSLRNFLLPLRGCTPLWTQIRHVRPVVRKGPDVFKVTVDVRQYTRYELRVKAKDKYLLIEGKQERKIEDGYILRKFAKKFKLPPGCNPDDMTSYLNHDGFLTVEAKRTYFEPELPSETYVPISLSDSDENSEEALLRKSKRKINPCKHYPRVRARPAQLLHISEASGTSDGKKKPPPHCQSSP